MAKGVFPAKRGAQLPSQSFEMGECPLASERWNMVCKHLRIGKIVNTQGIKGEIRVIPLTDDISRFDDLKYVLIDDEMLIKAEVEYVRYHKGLVILKLKGMDSIDDAQKYKNMYILVPREDAIKLPKGHYFICDIIGLEVLDIEGASLGRVTDVITTGSNDVYVVKDGDKEILIPALKTVVRNIDIENGRLVVKLPEGLI